MSTQRKGGDFSSVCYARTAMGLTRHGPSDGDAVGDGGPVSFESPAASPSPPSSSASPTCPLLYLPSRTSRAPCSQKALPAMKQHDGDHPPPPPLPAQNLLWRPGSTSYPPASRQAMDPVQSKQQLEMLYEQLSESSYDLSLRDIVDPSYSISGNLKSGVGADTGTETRSNSNSSSKGSSSSISSSSSSLSNSHKHKTRSRWRSSDHRNVKFVASPKCRLSFSFSFPGMNALRSRSRGSQVRTVSGSGCSAPSTGPEEQSQASLTRSRSSGACPLPKSKQYPYSKRKGEFNQRQYSATRVHPSNQCSSCSSYTIFFKSRCLVCGKLYCSNCAKDAMDIMSDGRKCKGTCTNRLLSRRFSRKTGKSCWPFCVNTDVRELQFKHTRNGA